MAINDPTIKKLTNKQYSNERRREVRLRRIRAARMGRHMSSKKALAVTYKIAQGTDELENAFRLVWRRYVDVGLQRADDSHIRFTKYHLLPTTKILIATYCPELEADSPNYAISAKSGSIVGTLSMVFDTPLGLPIEELCEAEVKQLRDQKHQLVEIIGLAINPDFREDVVMHLYRMMFSYVAEKGATDVVCSVVEKHHKFYQNALLFKSLGETKAYGPANNEMTQGHILNIKSAEEHAKKVYSAIDFDADLHTFFFKDTRADNRPVGEGKPWTPDQLRYFLTERSQMLEMLDDDTKVVLREEYRKAGLLFPF